MTSSTERADFDIRRADWTRDGEVLRLIRRRVFIEGQGVHEDLEWDGQDEQATHLLAVDGRGRPIGTARLLPSGQIGRMAVVPEWRGRGVGHALLRRTLEIAAAQGQPHPFLNAQTTALPFYARMGLTPVGEEFMEAGIPHRRMVLERPTEAETTGLDGHILGQTAGSVELHGRDHIRAAGIRMAGQSRRELRIFSHDLDPDLYDNREFLEAVRAIALRGREAAVRVLLVHAEPAIRRGHRLIEAARQLSSKVQIRGVPLDFQRHTEAYLLADDRGFLLRRLADTYEAVADFNDPKEVRRLRQEFEQIWALGEIHQELRRLHL
jgi:predicted GNAT family N-acyltransferase